MYCRSDNLEKGREQEHIPHRLLRRRTAPCRIPLLRKKKARPFTAADHLNIKTI